MKFNAERGGEASFRFNVYNAFGVRSIFRGSQGALVYHPSARQMRFGTKIWVSRRYGKSSSIMAFKIPVFQNTTFGTYDLLVYTSQLYLLCDLAASDIYSADNSAQILIQTVPDL